MDGENRDLLIHPQGEGHQATLASTLEDALRAAGDDSLGQVRMETPGGTVFVEWDPHAPLTPIGQLVFFVQFLDLCGHFERLCQTCPVRLTSSNAPDTRDVLGTFLMGILCGQHRYAHLSALRFDPINPGLLSHHRDENRRTFRRGDGAWRLHQWRGSGGHHSYFIGTLRVCLDVEVESGDRCAAKHAHAGLWKIIDELPPERRPALVRGDLAFGEEKLMSQCEERGQKYLFKLRQSPKVKMLIKQVERSGKWEDAGQGFEGIESSLRLVAWSRERRVIILRRPVKKKQPTSDLPLLENSGISVEKAPTHEFMVLITNEALPILGVAQLYRDRADVENCFDELKNQWGWGGFTTKDQARSQTMARLVALVYNWWSLFVGLIDPSKHAEAITSRPQLLHGVARKTQSGRQTTLSITSPHNRAAHTQERQTWVGRFLSALKTVAEQLSRFDIWRIILSCVFVRFLRGRIIGCPSSDASLVPI